MPVTIRLFARLRDIAGAAELRRPLPDGAATLRGIWLALSSEFPELGRYSASISGAVNGEYARLDAAVQDGDEVAFLPPVSGGREDHVR